MLSVTKHKYFLSVVFFLLLVFFVFLSHEVYEGDVFNFDHEVFEWSHSTESPVITTFALACTFLGSQTFLLPANLILAGIFFFRHKHRAYAWKIALVSASSAGFLFLIKYIVRRPRPESPLLNAALHYSFPSGHTFTSITFFGIVVYFVSESITKSWLKQLIIFAGILIVMAIAWSRVYLHVHYATDVIAGFCLGCMWLIMAKWFLLEKKAMQDLSA